jgi:hypothetical protein
LRWSWSKKRKHSVYPRRPLALRSHAVYPTAWVLHQHTIWYPPSGDGPSSCCLLGLRLFSHQSQTSIFKWVQYPGLPNFSLPLLNDLTSRFTDKKSKIVVETASWVAYNPISRMTVMNSGPSLPSQRNDRGEEGNHDEPYDVCTYVPDTVDRTLLSRDVFHTTGTSTYLKLYFIQLLTNRTCIDAGSIRHPSAKTGI